MIFLEILMIIIEVIVLGNIDANAVFPAIFANVPFPLNWLCVMIVGIIELVALGWEIIALFTQ